MLHGPSFLATIRHVESRLGIYGTRAQRTIARRSREDWDEEQRRRVATKGFRLALFLMLLCFQGVVEVKATEMSSSRQEEEPSGTTWRWVVVKGRSGAGKDQSGPSSSE